jgi:hypothetical protein
MTIEFNDLVLVWPRITNGMVPINKSRFKAYFEELNGSHEQHGTVPDHPSQSTFILKSKYFAVGSLNANARNVK